MQKTLFTVQKALAAAFLRHCWHPLHDDAYEAVGRHESNDYAKIYAALQTVEHNARAYFLQCGNSIVQPKDPDEATAEILYMFYNRHSCVNEPFSSRVNRVVVDTMAAENKVIGIDPIPSIPIAHFLAPRGIDLTHHNYIIMDGRYYTILYTQFERGEALISSNNNKVPVVIKASKIEKEMITTDRAELETLLHERQQNQTHTE